MRLKAFQKFFEKQNISGVRFIFYRNLFSVVPEKQTKEVSHMLKALHVQECKASAQKSIASV
ncbi:putative transposase [Eubacterium callanderi]|uniref:Transposase n=1 Tax=Eubacterium callanderi TaxID=53442 RepID=E3GGJ4_9FIRM|nr:putative transposase [Eubacterium callanderi]